MARKSKIPLIFLLVLLSTQLAAALPAYFASKAGGNCSRHPSSDDGSRLGQHPTGSLGTPDQGITFTLITDESGTAVSGNQVCPGVTYTLRVGFPSSHYLLTSSGWSLSNAAGSACPSQCSLTRFCAQNQVPSGTHTFTVPCTPAALAGNVFRVTRADGWMGSFRTNSLSLSVTSEGCPSKCAPPASPPLPPASPPPPPPQAQAPPKSITGLPKGSTLAVTPAANTNRKKTLTYTARMQGFTAAEARAAPRSVSYGTAGIVTCTVAAPNTRPAIPTARVTCTAVAVGRSAATVCFGETCSTINFTVRRT